MPYRTGRICAFFATLALVGALLVATLPARAATPTIRIDGNSAGRTFDGVGALRAGASSRLLID